MLKRKRAVLSAGIASLSILASGGVANATSGPNHPNGCSAVVTPNGNTLTATISGCQAENLDWYVNVTNATPSPQVHLVTSAVYKVSSNQTLTVTVPEIKFGKDCKIPKVQADARVGFNLDQFKEEQLHGHSKFVNKAYVGPLELKTGKCAPAPSPSPSTSSSSTSSSTSKTSSSSSSTTSSTSTPPSSTSKTSHPAVVVTTANNRPPARPHTAQPDLPVASTSVSPALLTATLVAMSVFAVIVLTGLALTGRKGGLRRVHGHKAKH